MLKQALWAGDHPLPQLPSNDRSFCYGDGLFTSVRIVRGERVWWDAHWRRLSDGAERLQIPLSTGWQACIDDFCEGIAEGVLRVHISRGAGGRGYQWPEPMQPILVLTLHALPVPQPWSQQGIRLADTQLRLAEQPRLAGIKHANRLEQVLLRAELAAQPDCQEALVLDASGRVLEGVFSNLFFYADGAWHTPSVQRCGVNGVLRQTLMAYWQQQGVPVRDGDYYADDLLRAEEICVGNSLNGLWPVCAWRERTWQIGAQTRQSQAYLATWYG